jgi:hydroxypyruvate reductase
LIDPKALLRRMFDAALGAADPANLVASALPERPKGRTLVVGAGKAAASMARAVEAAWDGPLEGVVVTRYGHGAPTRHIRVVEAGHPMPDEAGQRAAAEILALAQGLGPDDLLLALISGGGSALLSLPAPGLTLEDKRGLTAALLRSGATISEINTVRRQVSAIKGGKLAMAAFPARVHTLAISDVPGDDPCAIASGPTIPDRTGPKDAVAVLKRYDIPMNASVSAFLNRPVPPPAELARLFDRADYRFIARPIDALLAAAHVAQAAGITPLLLGDAIEGEAREVGRAFAGIARSIAEHGVPVNAPAVLLSGGETTVTVRGQGRGGRNAEFALGAMLALEGFRNIWGIACDTDGIDGSEDNAGARFGPDSLERARAAGLDPVAQLLANDAWSLFNGLDDLIVTGPTLTNVNDFRAILVA